MTFRQYGALATFHAWLQMVSCSQSANSQIAPYGFLSAFITKYSPDVSRWFPVGLFSQSKNSRHCIYCHPTLCITKSRWFPVHKDRMTLSTWVVLHTRCSVNLLSVSVRINFYQGQPIPSLVERMSVKDSFPVDLLSMWMSLISTKDSRLPLLHQMAMKVNGL